MTNPNDPARKPPIDLDENGQELHPEAHAEQGAAPQNLDAQDTGAETDTGDLGDFDPDDLDPNMFAGVQEMMAKLGRADELETENADLKGRLGRLAADFENYRRRTQEDVQAAQSQGVAKAAEALMPVYDDVDRALSMGAADPTKLVPGMQAVQAKVRSIFAQLGLEATGQEGETFDPQWHEALQVVPGEVDDVVVQVFQVGFRMDGRLVRPARVVVSRRE
jgi:molecular chaperone GrpE